MSCLGSSRLEPIFLSLFGCQLGLVEMCRRRLVFDGAHACLLSTYKNLISNSNAMQLTVTFVSPKDDPINFIGIKMTNSKYGRTIPTATIPKILKPGHVQQIYVTEVTKFPYFYFQFASTDHTMRGLQEQLK